MKHMGIKTHSVISIFPTGDYKMIIHGAAENGDNLFTTIVVASLDTPNKDTFG